MKKVHIAGPTLSFYDHLRTEVFNNEEFKENAILRLKILRKVENGINDFSQITTVDQDLNTHFCLRLIAAQSSWTIKWFVTMETKLFSFRIGQDLNAMKHFFLEKIWPHLNVTENIEYDTAYSPDYQNRKVFVDKMPIHFSKCSDILPRRTQKLHLGYFKINDEVMVSFLAETFKKWLETQMNELYEKIAIESDERLIKYNHSMFSAPESNAESRIGNVMSKSELFPLCIKGILERLKRQRHLKYNDRQTLCLFLKDIGMELNECIDFFKKSFSCTPDKFNKEYLYSIRHNYGLEGKRANYTSHPCTRIIGSSKDGSSFGCPFINNHDFVKMNSDIEDLDRDAIKCCGNVGKNLIGKELEKVFYSPADYFRLLYKEKNVNNE